MNISRRQRGSLVKRECSEELQCRRKTTYGATGAADAPDCHNTQPQRLTLPGVVSDTVQSRELILHVNVPRASTSQLRKATVRISVRKNSTLSRILLLEARGDVFRWFQSGKERKMVAGSRTDLHPYRTDLATQPEPSSSVSFTIRFKFSNSKTFSMTPIAISFATQLPKRLV
jgi:broad specificity polyphosphatase/5'/3'-nucleotidase SurE